MSKLILFFISIGFYFNCFAQDFWMELDRPYDGRVLSMIGNRNGNIFLGMSNGIYVRSLSDILWQQQGLNGLSVYSLYLQDDGTVYAGTGGINTIYKMENSSFSWIPIYDGVSNVLSIVPDLSKNVYASSSGLIKTVDDGENWEQIYTSSNSSEQVNSIVFYNDNRVYIGCADFIGEGGVYYSNNLGADWINIGLKNYYIQSIAVDSYGTIYAGSVGNFGVGIYSTLNNGNTWNSLKTDVFVSSIVITPENVIYIGCTNEHGTQGGVFQSTNLGLTWEIINSGLEGTNNQNVYGLCLSNDGYLYCYGDHLHKSSAPVCSAINNYYRQEDDVIFFPNPVKDHLNVQLLNNEISDKNINFEIYAYNGTLMRSSVLDLSCSTTIEIDDFLPGRYVIIFHFENKQIVKRFVIT